MCILTLVWWLPLRQAWLQLEWEPAVRLVAWEPSVWLSVSGCSRCERLRLQERGSGPLGLAWPLLLLLSARCFKLRRGGESRRRLGGRPRLRSLPLCAAGLCLLEGFDLSGEHDVGTLLAFEVPDSFQELSPTALVPSLPLEHNQVGCQWGAECYLTENFFL